MATVLIVDDNPAVCMALELLLSLQGLKTRACEHPQAAQALIEDEDIDLVIQDMNFGHDHCSGEDGVALFHALRARDPQLPVILLTAWTNLEQAVELVRCGAADYIGKPWDDHKLVTTVLNLLQLRRTTQENQRLKQAREAPRQRLAGQFDLCGLVYASDSMHELVTLATRVAHAPVPVLIKGPNGAGKEKIAEIIQANSAVRNGPFVRVNIGALPPELISAELFGAEAGAYTGAQKTRVGRFEAADGGTLFIDELGTLGAEGQVKLLRVLQTGEFERLGSTQTRRVNVRVISATNADLRQLIRDGRFREDLYYRLNVIELSLPPLHQRSDDILPIARRFVDDRHQLSPAAERALLQHRWPGNVRELQNCITRACLLAADRLIQPQDLGLSDASGDDDAVGAAAALPEPDRDSVIACLQRHAGAIAPTARALGLSRQALYRRMDRLGIPRSNA